MLEKTPFLYNARHGVGERGPYGSKALIALGTHEAISGDYLHCDGVLYHDDIAFGICHFWLFGFLAFWLFGLLLALVGSI